MTINTQTGMADPQIGDGVNLVFPFDFKVATAAEVAVYVDGQLIDETAYTVDLSDGWSGDVTFDVAPTDGAEVVLVSNPLFTQSSVHLRQGPFYADIVEDDLDKARIIDIFLKREVDRAFKLPLINPISQAGKFPVVLADGTQGFSLGTGADAGLRTDIAAATGSTLLGFQQAGTGATTRTARAKMRDVVSVFDFMSLAQIADVQARTRLVDVTAAIQAAINSNPGRLFFPAGDYLLGSTTTTGPDGIYALLVSGLTIEMFGKGATLFLPATTNAQALRFSGCPRASIRGLRFQGSGTNGTNGGQGLVQVYLGSNFSAEDCDFDDANCDGIAVAGTTGVSLANCRSDNASKTALYVNQSSNVRVVGCSAKNFGGHLISGNVVGAGLQLSGNTNLVAQGNTIRDGVGIGILCDASGALIPIANIIDANTVYTVSNPSNTAVSSGIRLGNDQATKNCATVVSNNTVRACGLYNYYVENHNGVVFQNNVGIESVESNFVIASVVGGTIKNNTALNTDTNGGSGQAAYYLLNGCTNVIGEGNRASTVTGFAAASGANAVLTDGSGSGNRLLLAGVMYAETAANIASLTSTVNTVGKQQGFTVYDTTNHRIMVADGSAAASLWWAADGSTSVTPV